MLRAVVKSKALVVSGAAARAGTSYIEVALTAPSGPTVIDNNSTGTRVAIEGDVSQIRDLNLRDLTGTGASVSSYNSTDRRVIASQQSDYIYLAGGNDEVTGLGGDDLIYTNAGNDTLDGGKGADRLEAGDGDDTIKGGAGNDAINGGAGIDTATYTGNRSDYLLETIEGSYRLTDLRGKSPDGADTLGNVEFLTFGDQVVPLEPNPTNLSAVVSGSNLIVSGAAARSGTPYIEVALTAPSGPTVIDNNSTGTRVAIEGDVSQIRDLNLRDLTGTGASVSSYNSTDRRVIASQQSDYIYLAGGNDEVTGLGGDDLIYTNAGNDTLDGGKGADRLEAGDGDDTIKGGAGNDAINGGAGIDTATYTGNRSDYLLETIEGSYRLTDLRGKSPDGADTLGNVEFLTFGDQVVPLEPNPTNLSAVVSGSTLIVSGAAARAGTSYIEVALTAPSGPTVIDNNSTGTRVAIEGDVSQIRDLNLRDLTGTGASVSSYNSTNRQVIASQQGDYIYLAGGNDQVFGLDGDDLIYTNVGNDTLDGGKGADRLEAGDGDDTIKGGAGDDAINGGAGIDTATYTGNRSDYLLETIEGSYRLTDLRTGAPEGSDSLGNIEFLQFSDQTISASSSTLPQTSDAFGGFSDFLVYLPYPTGAMMV